MKLKRIILFTILTATFSSYSQQEIIEEKVDLEMLNQEMVKIFSEVDDEINAEIGKRGGKLVLSKKSDDVDFKIFDVEENGKYIIEIFKAFNNLDIISDNIQIVTSIGENKFYSSFQNCGCTSTPLQIINLYKEKWNSVKIGIDKLQLSMPSANTLSTNKISSLITQVKMKKDMVDQKLIDINPDPNDHDSIMSYILKEAIPKNSNSILDLSKILNDLRLEIVSYITIVRLSN